MNYANVLYCFTYRSEQPGEPDGQVSSTPDSIHQPAVARTGKPIPHEQVPLSAETIRSGHQLVLV